MRTVLFSRTVSKEQFFAKNCVQWAVLFEELYAAGSSFSETVCNGQFFFENCIQGTVLCQELCTMGSSFSRTVCNEQFFVKNSIIRRIIYFRTHRARARRA